MTETAYLLEIYDALYIQHSGCQHLFKLVPKMEQTLFTFGLITGRKLTIFKNVAPKRDRWLSSECPEVHGPLARMRALPMNLA